MIVDIPADLVAFVAQAISVSADAPYDIPEADYERITSLSNGLAMLAHAHKLERAEWFKP